MLFNSGLLFWWCSSYIGRGQTTWWGYLVYPDHDDRLGFGKLKKGTLYRGYNMSWKVYCYYVSTTRKLQVVLVGTQAEKQYITYFFQV